jgi:hypothetical protein
MRGVETVLVESLNCFHQLTASAHAQTSPKDSSAKVVKPENAKLCAKKPLYAS